MLTSKTDAYENRNDLTQQVYSLKSIPSAG